MKYKIISGSFNHWQEQSDRKAFEERINKEIENGWKPCGGIQIVQYRAQDNTIPGTMHQAIIQEQ